MFSGKKVVHVRSVSKMLSVFELDVISVKMWQLRETSEAETNRSWNHQLWKCKCTKTSENFFQIKICHNYFYKCLCLSDTWRGSTNLNRSRSEFLCSLTSVSDQLFVLSWYSGLTHLSYHESYNSWESNLDFSRPWRTGSSDQRSRGSASQSYQHQHQHKHESENYVLTFSTKKMLLRDF